jgi:hypothetical protein
MLAMVLKGQLVAVAQILVVLSQQPLLVRDTQKGVQIEATAKVLIMD